MKAINLIWIIPVCLILGTVLGFGWGVSVEDVNIKIGRENLDYTLDAIQNISDGFVETINNQTCNYNVNMTPEMYEYTINSYMSAREVCQDQPKIVETFCKKTNSISTLHVGEARKLHLIEYGIPKEIAGHKIEIIGAEGYWEGDIVILSIDGSTRGLRVGESMTNGDIAVNVEDIFVWNIPTTGVMAKLDIFYLDNRLEVERNDN